MYDSEVYFVQNVNGDRRQNYKDLENKNLDLITENQQLKERLEQLEMENEYLKKLDALVRKRLQNQKKK